MSRKPEQGRERPAGGTGWHGETMPGALARAAEPGVYRWPISGAKTRAGIELVYVPPGEFTMGSYDRPVERPPHRHPLPRGYYIGRHPTTWRQFLAFCEATGREKPRVPYGKIGEDHPVVNVS